MGIYTNSKLINPIIGGKSIDGIVKNNNLVYKHSKVHIYGIKRALNSSSSQWERTDDAIDLIANAQVGTDSVVNDFDSLYPWSDIYTYSWNKDTDEEIRYDDPSFNYTDDYIFTKIPEFWYKRWQDNTNEYIQIATGKAEGFILCNEFSVGRYSICTDFKSKSGTDYLTSETRAYFRENARSLNSNLGILDWRYFLLQILYLVEYADYNSQKKLGNGVCARSQMVGSGECDLLGMKSGRIPNGLSVIYRGIENIFGNVEQYIDGININNYQIYICYDPTKYSDDLFNEDYQKISYRACSYSDYISKLGYDSNHSLISMPVQASGSNSTYICDYFNINTGSRIVGVGGAFNGGTYQVGLWNWDFHNDSSSKYYGIGARLLKYQ